MAQKLRIKPGFSLLTLHAPTDFSLGLGPLPEGVKLTRTGKKYDQVHWFVENRAQLEKELDNIMTLLKPDVTVWAYYPKVSSGRKTDLTRDKGWDALLAKGDQLSFISLVSFNDTWSVFGFRAKSESDKKKVSVKKPPREIFNWVNPQTKVVKLPADLASLLKKQKKEAAFFDSLSFTNKKEYIEWIVTAKKADTRAERLKGTMERLGKNWKNPRNL